MYTYISTYYEIFRNSFSVAFQFMKLKMVLTYKNDKMSLLVRINAIIKQIDPLLRGLQYTNKVKITNNQKLLFHFTSSRRKASARQY